MRDAIFYGPVCNRETGRCELETQINPVYRDTKKRQSHTHTFITPFGIKQNMYRDSVQRVVTADDLFRDA